MKKLGILCLVIFIVCLFVCIIWYLYRQGEVVHPSEDIEMIDIV